MTVGRIVAEGLDAHRLAAGREQEKHIDARLRAALAPATADRATLIVTQRVATIRGADEIEIWLPVHYQATGAAQVGDAVRLTAGSQTLELRVAGFVRDAQMNPSIVTSKRLVVSQADYEAVAPYLTPEYLVEMRAAPGASTAALEDSYAAANLPSQGVSVSSTVFRLANGLSTYLLAAAVLLVAGLIGSNSYLHGIVRNKIFHGRYV